MEKYSGRAGTGEGKGVVGLAKVFFFLRERASLLLLLTPTIQQAVHMHLQELGKDTASQTHREAKPQAGSRSSD